MRFQERIHLQKFRLDQIQNGRLSAIIHFHMKAQSIKQNVTFQERMHFEFFFTRSNSKWPPICHYSLSHGGSVYKTKCDVSGEDAFWKKFDSNWLKFKMAVHRPLLLYYYYKTKCDVSGEDAPWNFLIRSNSKWPSISLYLPLLGPLLGYWLRSIISMEVYYLWLTVQFLSCS